MNTERYRMKFNDYQQQATTFELMKREGEILANSPSYVAKILGLAGEAGEVAEKYKKIIRDKDGHVSDADKAEIIKELGDVLWYVSALAGYLHVSLEDVAKANIDKLSSRKSRGTQHGNGDNR